MLGRVLPRLELPLARHVGPRLMRVPGQEQPLGDAEARVVLRERVQSSLRTAQRSGKNGLCSVERRYSAPYPPVPSPRADRPLDHLHVVVAPLHEALVEVDEPLGDLGGLAVVAVRAGAARPGRPSDSVTGCVTSRSRSSAGTA